MLALKLWYLFYFAASSCLYPYFNLFFRRAGLSEQQVGIVAALRPWIGLPSGATLSGVADKWRVHRLVLIVTLIISTMARLSVAAVATFPAILCIMLTADAFNACVTVIVDAAAMAACSKEGEYARQRLYGAIGWGCFSFIAGYAVQHFGNNAAFAMSAVLATATLGPTLVLPWGPLHAKLRHQHADEEALETNGGFAHATGKAGTTVHVGYEEDVYLRAAADVVSHPGLEEGTVRNRSPSRSPSKRPISAQSADCDGSDASIRRPEPNIRFFDSVATLASNPDALVFFGMVTVMGTAVGTIECILFLYLEDLGREPSPDDLPAPLV